MSSDQPNSAVGIRWNLVDLYSGLEDPAIERDLQGSLTASEKFAADYRGMFTRTPEITSQDLKQALEDLEKLLEPLSRLGSYAGLLTAVDNLNNQYRQFEDRVDQTGVEVQNRITFFELEWLAVAEERAHKLIDDPILSNYAHYLAAARRYQPYTLSEPEELILNQKSLTARTCWVNLFDEFLASLKYELEYKGEKKTLTQSALLALVYDPDRGLREAAQRCLYGELSKHSLVLTNIFNALTQDHGINDQVRKYTSPMASRHLANEVAPQVVDRMREVVGGNYSIAHDYFKLKARMLGLKKLATFDQYAPVATNLPACTYDNGKQTVLAAFKRFHPGMEDIALRFFQDDWIDAEVRPGKRGGAFSASTIPSVHPYIMLNWTERLRDVSTMAHELGHGIHQYLSRSQTYLNFHHPLTIAETASVFAEFLTFDYVMEIQKDPEVRLGLLCGKLEDAFATVFRQNVLTDFEWRSHNARRKNKLSAEEICEHWWQANHGYYGEALDMIEPYRWGWSYIPHFIHTPFYCYAYVFGELLVLSLYKMYKEEGAKFVPKYMELLKSGSIASPEVLLKRVGADITDAGFWQKGLDVLQDMVNQAVTLADQLKR